MKTICGIYKITSPSGKIYIGQSEDIYRRWKLYKSNYVFSCKCYKGSYPQHLLNSLKKYGHETHVFEIIETCKCEDLNNRETYWIHFLDTFNTTHGMNCTKGGDGVRGFRWSEEAREKQSRVRKGKKPWNKGISPSIEALEKNKEAQVKAWKRRKESKDYFSDEKVKRRKNKNPEARSPISKNVWKKIKESDKFYSEEEKEKRRLRAKKREHNKKENGYEVSEETKKRNSEASKRMWERKKRDGVPFFSKKALENMRNATGNRYSKEAIEKRAAAISKLILNTQTGIFYFGLKDAVASTNISYSTLSHKLGGSYKNNTNFIYV